jgi:hypothetical protein
LKRSLCYNGLNPSYFNRFPFACAAPWQTHAERTTTKEDAPLSRRTVDTPAKLPHSEYFSLRLWREELGEGMTEWRGRVQHVTSGNARYFRDWQALIGFLVEVLSNFDEDSKPTSGT